MTCPAAIPPMILIVASRGATFESPRAGFDLPILVMGLLGGLALFLYGMDKMAEALKAAAGERMKGILARLTANRLMGVFTGAFVTAVIQSSSVTTVLVVGFVAAGLMSLPQSIGVIMGANIGSTVTAQIIAFRVTEYALLMIAAGFAMSFLTKHERSRQLGAGFMGLGLIFLGMGVMGDAMAPLRTYQPFLDWMVRMEDPAIGILVGAVFTALIQSSAATTGIVIVMASQGFVTLPAGIALAFGANIGTCATAMLACVGRPREAIRAAVVHVLFNVAGVLVWLPFIDQLAGFVALVSPAAADLTGTARLAAEAPRQIANAHTTFNVVNTFLFIGLAPVFVHVVRKLVPDRPLGDDVAVVRARFLDFELLPTPSFALDRARLEILHMGERVRGMMIAILPAALAGSAESLRRIATMDDAVDVLHRQIVTYLRKISLTALTEDQTAELVKLLEATHDLENMGDIIETNLVALGGRRLEQGVMVSVATRAVLERFHAAVMRALDASLMAVTQKNEEAARLVVAMKGEINQLAESAALHQVQRLVAEEPNRLPTYSVEMDILENLKRIYYFCKRMARAAIPHAGV